MPNMELLRCIVVEDEPIAAEILEDYIGMIPFLKHVGTYHDPLAGLNSLSQGNVDVIFLDLSMPKLRGEDFIRSLTEKYKIVITTAHHEYALESYEWGVTDYLLKPIAFNRFVIAANKLRTPTTPKNIASPSLSNEPALSSHRFFNVNKTMIKIDLQEIRYVESLKEYVRIVTGDQSIVTKGSLQEFEQMLMDFGGLRIHRSFLVNVHHIQTYSAQELQTAGKFIPIGRQYKERVLEILGKIVL